MEALGMIEVVGLTAGIEAADVACKAANVELVGYELAKGGGFVTIKVLGKVGAVNAAVDAAASAAGRLTRVVSRVVIPRPSDQLDPLVHSRATVGHTAPAPAAKPSAKPAEKPEKPAAKPAAKTPAPGPEPEQTAPNEPAEAPAEATATTAKTTAGRK